MQNFSVRRNGDVERATSAGTSGAGTSAAPPATSPYAPSGSPDACAGTRTVRDIKPVAPLGCVVFSASTCTHSERDVASWLQKGIEPRSYADEGKVTAQLTSVPSS